MPCASPHDECGRDSSKPHSPYSTNRPPGSNKTNPHGQYCDRSCRMRPKHQIRAIAGPKHCTQHRRYTTTERDESEEPQKRPILLVLAVIEPSHYRTVVNAEQKPVDKGTNCQGT